ncbi:MAG: 4-hydroxy-3-methylbut-2-enyl diphosphate reductase, partial [uncultured bacterium]
MRNALKAALQEKNKGELTIAGQLVHNPQTVKKLLDYGIQMIDNFSSINKIKTKRVMITAHGAPKKIKTLLKKEGFTVEDATCPLVSKVHKTIKNMVKKGLYPVVIGHPEHVEVKGIRGDLKDSFVVFNEDDLSKLENLNKKRLGIVSQTTNEPEVVEKLVEKIKALKNVEYVEFANTVCKPTRDRQKAVDELAKEVEMMIVIGGYNSSNTKKLLKICEKRNIPGHHIENSSELKKEWFKDIKSVGITAGTSTPLEVIEEVHEK